MEIRLPSKFRPSNRALIGITIIIATIAITHGALAIAEFGPSTKCAPTFLFVKWPMGWAQWLGCSISLHESLAAGLLGTGGAVFAGWLAYSAAQLQLDQQREQTERAQSEAKAAAVVILSQPVHAAGATLMVLRAANENSAGKEAEFEKLISLGVTHIKNTLSNFTVSEGIKGLGTDDRILYLVIINTLSSFVNIGANPSPLLSLQQGWANQLDTLLKLHRYLVPFDKRLAEKFALDGGL